MMGGVTEPVPISKSLPGIVQLLQKLPLGLIRRIDPLMGSFYDYMNVSSASSPRPHFHMITGTI